MNPQRQAFSVLLVDDEAYFRRFVGHVLKQEGVGTVTEAHNGREGVKLFETLRPQLVVLDINMPQMDGVEALQEFRRLSPTVPIIMLTSIAEESVVEDCVKFGASYFIRKDVSAASLQAELTEMLRLFCQEEKHDAGTRTDLN